MVDFALSMGAFLLIALGLGMAFAQTLCGAWAAFSGLPGVSAPKRNLQPAFLLIDGGALLLTAILAIFVRADRPDVWFVLTAFVFLIGAVFWSWITRPGRNKTGSVAPEAQGVPASAGWIGFGARLAAFAAVASFALLTRPPCPPCAGG